MATALLLIDLQNDYFAEGNFPLWNADAVLEASLEAIVRAQRKNIPIVLVQHVSANPQAKFFRAGTCGVDIHPRVLAAAPDAPIITKQRADAFHRTTLDETLRTLDIEHLLVGGMMSQNCVTHTALSPLARDYRIGVLSDCITTVDATIHAFALDALGTHLDVRPSIEAI